MKNKRAGSDEGYTCMYFASIELNFICQQAKTDKLAQQHEKLVSAFEKENSKEKLEEFDKATENQNAVFEFVFKIT